VEAEAEEVTAVVVAPPNRDDLEVKVTSGISVWDVSAGGSSTGRLGEWGKGL